MTPPIPPNMSLIMLATMALFGGFENYSPGLNLEARVPLVVAALGTLFQLTGVTGWDVVRRASKMSLD